GNDAHCLGIGRHLGPGRPATGRRIGRRGQERGEGGDCRCRDQRSRPTAMTCHSGSFQGCEMSTSHPAATTANRGRPEDDYEKAASGRDRSALRMAGGAALRAHWEPASGHSRPCHPSVLTRRLMLDDSSLTVVLAQQATALAFAVVLATVVQLAGGTGWELTGLSA